MSRPTDDWSRADDPPHPQDAGRGYDAHGHDGAGHDDEHYLDEQYVDEHDPSLADDVLLAEEHHDEEQLRPRRRHKRSPVLRWALILGSLAVLLVAGFLGVQAVRELVPEFSMGSDAPEDYEGQGTGEVTVEIPPGAGGGQIGEILAEADVVASAAAFAATAAANPDATGIQPGTYAMRRQMSAAAALNRLLEPGARQVQGVTVREGLWVEEVFAVLAEATGNDVADYEAVEPDSLDLPEAAEGELEGFLFPDTYEFPDGATPQEQLQAMVDLGERRYAELGIPEDELRRTIVVASLVQAEGMFAEDLPKIARVVENRLADGEPLGFDSTIHFIFKERGRAGTTDAQRAEESPYNTYLNAGLPPGPINSPGAAAIEATLNPAEGTWKYFVTVNPSTGETVFTDTYDEHLEYVQEFEQWCRDNPDQC